MSSVRPQMQKNYYIIWGEIPKQSDIILIVVSIIWRAGTASVQLLLRLKYYQITNNKKKIIIIKNNGRRTHL